MRVPISAFAVAGLLLLPGFAQENDDPFAIAFPLEPLTAPPATVTLLFEWIEIEHADLHRLLSVERLPLDGFELRKQVAGLIEAGKADLVEATAAHAASGKRGLVHSVEERIYQTEYDPPGFIPAREILEKYYPKKSGVPIPHIFYAAETRHVGFTVEFDAVLFEERDRVDLYVSAEKVEFEGMRPWGEKESELLTPFFYSADSTIGCRLTAGRSRLLSTHRLPAPVNPKRSDPRILVFARAEIGRGDAEPKERDKEKTDRSGDCSFLIEIIETDKHRFTELAARDASSPNGAAIHTGLLGDVATGRARAVDTLVLSGNSVSQSKSVHELIFPSDFAPPDLWQNGRITPAAPQAFETRYLGTIFFLKKIRRRENSIRGELEFEIISHLGEIKSGKNESEVAMPRFHRQSVETTISLTHGADEMLGSFLPPKRANPDQKETVRILFIRGESIERITISEDEKRESDPPALHNK